MSIKNLSKHIKKLSNQIDKAFSFEASGLIVFIVTFVLSDYLIRIKMKEDERGEYDKRKHLGYLLLISSVCSVGAMIIDLKYESK